MRLPRVAILVVIPAAILVALCPWQPARADESPRWGFGWDPGANGSGLTVRYKPSAEWEIGLSAGPSDNRGDASGTGWLDSDAGLSDYEYRRVNTDEEGWVDTNVARTVWRQDRLSVGMVTRLGYRWSNAGSSYREPSGVTLAGQDFRNSSLAENRDDWRLAVGIRPTWDVARRVQLQFEAGLVLSTGTTRQVQESWYDIDNYHRREEQRATSHTFGTFGNLDSSTLKLIFWF